MFDETGMYLAAFIVEGEIVSEIEVPVSVHEAPVKLSKEVEDGLKKSDMIWIGTEGPRGPPRGRAGVVRVQERTDLRALAEGAGGATSRPSPAPRCGGCLVTRGGRVATPGRAEFPAAMRVIDGAEFDEAATPLVGPDPRVASGRPRNRSGVARSLRDRGAHTRYRRARSAP